MAIQAGRALPRIAGATAVFVIHFRLAVLVAQDALEYGIVGRIDMAVIAVVPRLAMPARVDREVLRVVVPVGRRPRGC